jgi:hypothetical protein
MLMVTGIYILKVFNGFIFPYQFSAIFLNHFTQRLREPSPLHFWLPLDPWSLHSGIQLTTWDTGESSASFMPGPPEKVKGKIWQDKCQELNCRLWLDCNVLFI